jgi:hypothetical protein
VKQRKLSEPVNKDINITKAAIVLPALFVRQKRKPEDGFLSLLSAPARRALEREGLTTLKQLSKKTETELLELHGIGPATLPRLNTALKEEGLSFKK